MPKLVKCEAAKERDMIIHCPGCAVNLKDVPETIRGAEKAVFLCPKCHSFFDERGVIPYEEADAMFPGESDYSY
jgi:uncharacterized paraquat-inducible protein A